MKFKNVVVTKKTGKYPNYRYTGYYDEICFGIFFKKVSFEDYTWSHFPPKVDNFVEELGKGIKSKDDCCKNPDIEIGNWYYISDIILGYLLNNEDYEVLNYCFTEEDVNPWVRFLYKGFDCCYESMLGGSIEWFGVQITENKVYQKACLNCNTCDNSEEEDCIQRFKDWLGREISAKERKERISNICGDSCEN